MTLKVFSGEIDAVESPSPSDREAARALIEAYLKQVAQGPSLLFRELKPKDYEAGREILNAAPEQQVAAVVKATAMLAKYNAFDFDRLFPLKSLLTALLRKKLPFDHSSVERLIQTLGATNSWETPLAGILRAVERHVENHGVSAALRKGLESLRGKYRSEGDYAEERKIGKRIDAILDSGLLQEEPFDLKTGEAWTDALLVELGQMDDSARDHWRVLLAHCATAKSSKPSKKWLKQAGGLLAPIGEQAFAVVTIRSLAAIGQPGASQKVSMGGWTHYTDPTQIHDTHSDLLRGLIWTTSVLDNEQLIVAVGDAAETCFKKIPNVGPRSPKTGNACLQALSSVSNLAAVAQISRLKTRVKHASIRKQLAKALERAAENVGMTEADLEEIAIPTFGLTEVGRYEQQIGDFSAELSLGQTGKTQLLWTKPDGKKQKTVPAAIKESRADEIKALKQKGKEIEKLLPAQRNRLEQLFLKRRSWKLSEFRKRFLDHPLVGVLAQRLIWRLQANERIADGIWHNGEFVDSEGQPLDWGKEDAEVTIWRPMLSDVDEVLNWREWLERHSVCQPFKQAHREIYILTDAERETEMHSNRFAAHIVRQHQFAALCQQRGWRYSLEGAWDSANTPYLELPEWGLRTEFWVESIGDTLGSHTSQMGIFLYMSTDQVRFCGLQDGLPIPLADVPPLVFSEVMRDVDLFVGVSSVGADPNWADGGPDGRYREYWHDFSFGDLSQSAQTRKQVLERLIPRLKIADRCGFDAKFLVVRGDIRTYKIHLGSGNVLMSPNNEYLCVVPKRSAGGKRTDNLFLPFEGDNTLAVILSKAFLLADDVKIKDDSILSQIRRLPT